MKDFKIGDSDELVTVTRSKWEAHLRKIDELEYNIVMLNKGNAKLWEIDMYKPSLRRYVLELYVMTNDEALGTLAKKHNEFKDKLDDIQTEHRRQVSHLNKVIGRYYSATLFERVFKWKRLNQNKDEKDIT